MPTTAHDAERLQEMARALFGGEIDRHTARGLVADVVLDRIGCSRTGLWKFAGAGVGLKLVCFGWKRRGGQFETSERWLGRVEYRDYFQCPDRERYLRHRRRDE